jgi:raffinose/stachyose/melibiose transport system permease protein
MKTSLSDRIGMILFVLPVMILFSAFFIFPVGYVGFTSLLKWNGMAESTFIGLKNFGFLLQNGTFLLSIRNNVIWALVGGFIQIPLAILIAMLLANKPRGWKILRTIYFFPNIISGVALAMMWGAIFNNEYGALNGLLNLLGLGAFQHNWLGEMETALPSMLIYWVFYIGYFMVIILAEITSIPETYYEAEKIDGATTIQQGFMITLPLIKGSVSTCLTLAMVYGIRQFEQVFLLTSGGPGNATTTMSLYLYKQLQNYNYGMANASGVILICIGAIVIVSIKSLFKVEQYQV